MIVRIRPVRIHASRKFMLVYMYSILKDVVVKWETAS